MSLHYFKAITSHKTDEWYTPIDFFSQLDQEFNFQIDLCASVNAHLKETYYTIDNPVPINIHFKGNVFCNPPYSLCREFVEYCYYKAFEDNIDIVMLLPCRTNTKWFHKFIYNKENVELRFIEGRLKFSNKGYAPFPSMVVIFRGSKPN